MTDEEQEDLEFQQYLRAKYYEGLFAEADIRLLMGGEE